MERNRDRYDVTASFFELVSTSNWWFGMLSIAGLFASFLTIVACGKGLRAGNVLSGTTSWNLVCPCSNYSFPRIILRSGATCRVITTFLT